MMTVNTNAVADSLESLLMPGPLIEGHKKLEDDCSNCHKPLGNIPQRTLCLDCHEDIKADIESTTGVHGHQSQRLTDCKTCHTDHKGRDVSITLLDQNVFDHANTRFELKDGHQALECIACHVQEKKFREAESTCENCHTDDDVHGGELGDDCADCHTEKAWKEARFDHDKTDFSLKGKHQEVECLACHVSIDFQGAVKECYACHKINDVHGGAFGQECNDCHTEKKWSDVAFDHDKNTDYPLTGGHAKATCQSCHTDGDFEQELKTECSACHQEDDIHAGRNGVECDSCHTTKVWSKQTFDHDETDFKLVGSHTKVNCTSCHKGDVYKDDLKTDCFSCHQADDVHDGQQGESCERCHNESGWQEKVVFDHELTRFPLSGLHASLACGDCHLSTQYSDIESDCQGCHEDDEHEGRLGNDCKTCHSPAGWEFWLFDHDKQTDYPLTGEHQGLQCQACHTRPVDGDVTLSSACNDCHADEDVHNGSYGRSCESCHNTKSFNNINHRFR
jgi:hypothetical protein